jgi:hypothetical protein
VITSGFPDAGVAEAVRLQWEALSDDLHRMGPTLAAALESWAPRVMGDPPWSAFTRLESYPLVHLPIWAAPSLPGPPLGHITRSTIAGYLYVRLTDNALDADTEEDEIELLPLAAYLHTEFQHAYLHLFGVDSAFWNLFRTAWTRANEAALADRQDTHPDLDRFESVTARKTMGAIIPVAAALQVCGQESELSHWQDFVTSFGRFHQLENDLFGWRKDLRHGSPNLLLGEAERSGNSPHTWFLDAGFAWAADLLMGYADRVVADASALASPALIAYLQIRFEALRSNLDGLKVGIVETARLARLLGITGSTRSV